MDSSLVSPLFHPAGQSRQSTPLGMIPSAYYLSLQKDEIPVYLDT
ncbi:MAG TPA: hypothetical protein PKJ53_04470 [Spirochaetales bacterium]|nr:hypothetical protein [Spirochaetales bacterium]